jgi:hypothetical protein
MPKAAVDLGPEPALQASREDERRAWAAAQSGRVVALCNRTTVGYVQHCATSRVGTVQAGRVLKPARA